MVVKYISESLEFEVVSQEQRDGVLENAIDLMKNIVIDAIEKRKDRYSSDKFFKELATNKIVLDKIKETLQKKDYQQC